MSKNRVLNAGIGYTIGNILVKGINFLSIPIFSRLLTTEEFGIYNVFVSYEALLYVVIGFALHTSIKSANVEFKKKIDDYTSSISLIYIINLGLFLVIAIFFKGVLTKLLNFSFIIIFMLILYSFGNAVIMLYNQRVSLQYNYKKYLLVAFCNSFGNLVLSLGLILTIFNQHKALGRIVGLSITSFFIAIYLIYLFKKNGKIAYQKEYWVFGINYSLPIVPHGLSQVLLAQFDRIMIRSIVSNSAAGIYSLSGNLKLILTIITDSIATVWQTWFYEQMQKNEIKKIQERAIQLCGLFCIFSIGMMSISTELIQLLGGKSYLDGRYVAIPMIIDAFILFIYNIIVTAEYYKKKTTYIMVGTMIAALINVITNYIFIRRFGYIAAAYTTLFSYVCYLFLHIYISKKVIHFYVLPLRWIIFYSFLVSIIGGIDLWFIDNIWIRWFICALTVLPMGLWLIKVSNVLNHVEKTASKRY